MLVLRRTDERKITGTFIVEGGNNSCKGHERMNTDLTVCSSFAVKNPKRFPGIPRQVGA
jgi:hypothetical protein